MENLGVSSLKLLNVSHRVSGISHIKATDTWHASYNISKHNIVYFIIKGACTVTIDNKNYSCSAGDFSFIPAGTYYSYCKKAGKALSLYWFHFDLLPPINLCEQLGAKHFIHFDDPSKITALFDELCEIGDNNNPADLIKTKAIIWTILSEYIRASSCAQMEQSNFDNDPFNYLLRYIKDNLSTPLNNELLAQILCMHPNNFIRYFKKHMAITPQRYITKSRIQLAKDYLEKTDMKIADIADATGFVNTAHMAKTFRLFFGETPTQFRNRIQIVKK